MRFLASKKSQLLDPYFDGHVHSIFHSVINLRLNNQDLLSVIANKSDLISPYYITIGSLSDVDFTKLISNREPLSCRGEVIRFSKSNISIDLRFAAKGKNSFVKSKSSCFEKNINTNWKLAWSFLTDRKKKEGLALVLDGSQSVDLFHRFLITRTQKIIPQLLISTQTRNIGLAKKVGQQLLGLGPGLTPSGDDFLLGFIVGSRAAARKKEHRVFLNDFGHYLKNQNNNSVDISLDQLNSVISGPCSYPITDLCKSILNCDSKDKVNHEFNRCLKIGHSSGMDSAFGLLCGMVAWKKELADLITDEITSLIRAP
ncbi:MAG: hypothetical protein CL568_08690 [Alphaproteobacteria bacterium]|jgi:hypothetical protein|nr:hypothetical protein [Alphaproteobacteria bacterium]PPR13778.1 MAG: hypothetical protein CFH42_00641 [Alphaproteobacteria bacterium MarineAlpha12_Bin1]|tara:strand:+ start:582 stop:1523 length:942 start_codon:yes stop_codon:yes gene_type:complete